MWQANSYTALGLVILLTAFSPNLCGVEPEQSKWENLKRLTEGEKVQVVCNDGKSLRGKFVGFDDGAIRIHSKNGVTPVNRTEILRVSSLEKSKRLRNTLIGAGIGAAVGLAIGAGVEAHGDPETRHLTPVLTLVSLGIGSGVGAGTAGHPTVYRASGK